MTLKRYAAVAVLVLLAATTGARVHAAPVPAKLVLGMVPSREIGRMMENLGPA